MIYATTDLKFGPMKRKTIFYRLVHHWNFCNAYFINIRQIVCKKNSNQCYRSEHWNNNMWKFYQEELWNNLLVAYLVKLAEDFPETVPQQDLYFFLEPQGHALFLEIFNKKRWKRYINYKQFKKRGKREESCWVFQK